LFLGGICFILGVSHGLFNSYNHSFNGDSFRSLCGVYDWQVEQSLSLDKNSLVEIENNFGENYYLPEEDFGEKVEGSIVLTGKEVQNVKEFFEIYSPKLVDYAGVFVYHAVEHGFDYRLLVAIMGVESSFGKNYPYNTNNPFGISDGGRGLRHFDSLADSIAYLAKILSQDKAYKKFQQSGGIRDLAEAYCPPNAKKWEEVVKKFMKEIAL